VSIDYCGAFPYWNMPIQTSQAASLEVLQESVHGPDGPSVSEELDRPPPEAEL